MNVFIDNERIVEVRNLATGEVIFGSMKDVIPEIMGWGLSQQIEVMFTNTVRNLINPLTKGE